MKKVILLPLLICLTLNNTQGQNYWEISGIIGTSNSLTDIGGWDRPRRDFIPDIKFKATRWEIGAMVRKKIYFYNIVDYVTFRLSWVRIYGNDKYTIYPPRRYRNLHFRTDIIELMSKFDYVFYEDYDLGNTGRYRNRLRMYFFLGPGISYFNPMAEYKGKWVSLRPLRTEGQPKPYFFLLPVIGFGPGINIVLDKKYTFSWEFNWRIPINVFGNADYLDDIHGKYPNPNLLPNDLSRNLSNRTYEVSRGITPLGDIGYEQYGPGSPRGNPKENDNYLSTYFTIGYLIRGREKFYYKKYHWVVRKRVVTRRKARFKF